MKKLIFCICSFFLFVNGYSQKINPLGKKIVSSVVVSNYNSNGSINEQTKIFYSYNENGWLKSVKLLNNNGSITVVRKGYELKSNVYKYTTNENGYIISKEYKYNVKKDLIKKLTEYTYTSDCDEMFLTQISRQQFVLDSNIWSPSHDIFYLKFRYFDGNCYWEQGHSTNLNIDKQTEFYGEEVKFDRRKYGSIVNDTNINPNLFLSMLCWEICLDVHEFELSTEWCGMVSEHILKYENGFNIETVIDANTNISRMFIRYKNGNIFRSLDINYLY